MQVRNERVNLIQSLLKKDNGNTVQFGQFPFGLPKDTLNSLHRAAQNNIKSNINDMYNSLNVFIMCVLIHSIFSLLLGFTFEGKRYCLSYR
eukprot:UN25186